MQTFGDWALKLYAIAYARDEPGPELIRAAVGAAESALAEAALSDGRYGLGFLGIHEGRDSNFVFVSWWENENSRTSRTC